MEFGNVKATYESVLNRVGRGTRKLNDLTFTPPVQPVHTTKTF